AHYQLEIRRHLELPSGDVAGRVHDLYPIAHAHVDVPPVTRRRQTARDRRRGRYPFPDGVGFRVEDEEHAILGHDVAERTDQRRRERHLANQENERQHPTEAEPEHVGGTRTRPSDTTSSAAERSYLRNGGAVKKLGMPMTRARSRS